MTSGKPKPRQSVRIADPSTLDSFTLKSTKKKSLSGGDSEAEPDNLITVKEEAEDEVPIKEGDSDTSEDDEPHEKKPQQEEKLPQESKISKTLSEKTTKTVIILILIQLFLLPLI